MTLINLYRRFTDFLFAPNSALPLGMFRIVFGLVCLEYCTLMAPELITCFSDTNGILRLSTLKEIFAIPVIDVVAVLPAGDSWLIAFFALFATACLFMTVGLFSRISSVIVYVGLVSFLHRNIYVHHGGDHLMSLVAFWMMFAPIGASLSLDRYFLQKITKNPLPTKYNMWALKALQVQFVLIYWQASLSKIASPSWWDGTAMYYVFRHLEFARLPVPIVTHDLHLLQLITWSTIAVEITGWTLIWFKETRYPVLFLLLAMHLGIEYAMNIPIFEHIMIACLVMFIRGEDAEALFAKCKTWLKIAPSPTTLKVEKAQNNPQFLDGQTESALVAAPVKPRTVTRPKSMTYQRMTSLNKVNV